MDLSAYLQRIKYTGPVEPSLDTLNALHHQHLLNIPYENIDVQMGVPLDFDPERIFDKLVTRRRGGWCYEMNGLLSWALGEIGFEVTRMSGAVMREVQGDQQRGNHLVIEVMLDEPYLADVGLGDGARFPMPIREGTYKQGGLEYGLEKLSDGFWRFHNHKHSNVRSFDFRHEPASESELATKCQWLQTNPESPFRMLLITQKFGPGEVHVQFGKVYGHITPEGVERREILSIDEMHDHYRGVFGLEEDLTQLWESVCEAHERHFS